MSDIFIESCIQSKIQNPDIFLSWFSLLEISQALIENKDNIPLFGTNEFFSSRKTLTSSHKNPQIIQQDRLNNEILFYLCETPDLTKWACQDQRVDGLVFNAADINRLADESTINLLQENNKCIEINLREIFTNNIPIGYLRNIKKVVFRAIKKNVAVLISSYSSYPEELRSRKSIIGFSHFIGMPESYYTDVCQKWLHERIIRNRKRLNDNFISPDIWEISKGE